MGISEKKMQIVINNYFKKECDVNTSIREAFEKGFKIGVKKGPSAQPKDVARDIATIIENEKDMRVIAKNAQPEQADCEYCHEDSDGYVRPIEKNSHAWLVRRGRTMKLRVGFKGEYRECDILFCPMCGRRLTDG